MNVYLNYRLKTELEDEVNSAKAYFEGIGYEINIDGAQVFAFGNREKHNTDEPVGPAYLSKAKRTYEGLMKHMKCDIAIEGTIDTSETAVECMDFCFTSVDGQIKVKCSPWYIEICMDNIDDYERFCDIAGDFSEEEYESVKESEFVYILETEEGDKLAADIPMFDYDM